MPSPGDGRFASGSGGNLSKEEVVAPNFPVDVGVTDDVRDTVPATERAWLTAAAAAESALSAPCAPRAAAAYSSHAPASCLPTAPSLAAWPGLRANPITGASTLSRAPSEARSSAAGVSVNTLP